MDETVTVVLIKIFKLVDLYILFLYIFSYFSGFQKRYTYQSLKEICEYGSEILLTTKYLCKLIIF